MTDLNREQALNALQSGWGTYVARFQQLTPEAQAAFLARQGYGRLADLLAHVLAWWTEGRQMMTRMLADPNFSAPEEYDVEGFNARAIENGQALGEAAIIQAFEAMRVTLCDFTARLPEEAFQNPKLTYRLRIEVVDHLAEHEPIQ